MSEEREYWGYVRYADEDAKLRVALIANFRRGCPELAGYPQMSSSSGPKDYLKNWIWQVMESSRADEVYLVRGRGPVFVLLRRGNDLFGIEDRPVVLEQ
jgi:hypothetical protein